MSDDNYSKRGVSATKEDVHRAIATLDKGLFPNAFCKIIPDVFAGNDDWCTIMHSDGTGTKSALAYMYWKETGDLTVWRNLAQDAIVMNTDDMLCAGCTNNMVYTSVINRNKSLISGDVVSAIIEGTQSFFDDMRALGINITYGGGETADLGDAVRTITIDGSMSARMRRKDVIDCNIQPSDVIVGLASYGQATYEGAYNSGIGSNGLTLARHETLNHTYSKFTETYDPSLEPGVIYTGNFYLNDEVEGTRGLHTVGQMLLSPTRTYLPVVNEILNLHRKHIHAIIHCTGGGQGKVLKFIDGIHVIKNNLLAVPPVFDLISCSHNIPLQEMYRVFNMGQRLEFYVPEEIAADIIRISGAFNIDAQIIGHCEQATENKVSLRGNFEEIVYSSSVLLN